MGYYSRYELKWENAPDHFLLDHVIDILVAKNFDVIDKKVDSDNFDRIFSNTLKLRKNPDTGTYYIYHASAGGAGVGSRYDLLRLADHIQEKMGYKSGERHERQTWQTTLLGTNQTKWYTYVEDMKEVSKHFPLITFIIYRHGEDYGDMAKDYFINGKHECINARIEIFFDEPTIVSVNG